MDDNITKAEIHAMIDVQTKSAEQLTIIAKSLQDISAREDKIQARLYNGLSKEIVDGLSRVMKECEASRIKDIESMRKVADGVKSDTTFLKFLYSGLFGLVALAWLITQIVNHLIRVGVTK